MILLIQRFCLGCNQRQQITLILEKETAMTYIFLAVFGAIFFGLITLGRWEGEGRIINASWLDTEEKFRLISRWGLH